jgi:hypothetical protein
VLRAGRDSTKNADNTEKKKTDSMQKAEVLVVPLRITLPPTTAPHLSYPHTLTHSLATAPLVSAGPDAGVDLRLYWRAIMALLRRC